MDLEADRILGKRLMGIGTDTGEMCTVLLIFGNGKELYLSSETDIFMELREIQ